MPIDESMYVRHLRTINSDVSQKDMQKLKLRFRKQFSRQIVAGIIKKDHYAILKTKAWLKSTFQIIFIAAGWFDWTIWKPVFNIIDEAPVQRLYLSNFRKTEILYDVVHITFSKLRQLHLEDNLITSIEPLVGFIIPNLRKLDIRRNLIMSIQALKRCDFPIMKQINLSDNIICSCNCIAECYFPDLNRIVIEEKTHLNIYMIHHQGRGQRQLKSNSRVNGYDLRWILKLQTPQVQHIKYSADPRIIRKQIQEQIAFKYYKIRVQKKGMEMGSLLPLMSF